MELFLESSLGVLEGDLSKKVEKENHECLADATLGPLACRLCGPTSGDSPWTPEVVLPHVSKGGSETEEVFLEAATFHFS